MFSHPMNQFRLKYILLILAMLIVYNIHLAPNYIDQYITEYNITKLKNKFNIMLDTKSMSMENLQMLKILINNYSFVKNKLIFSTLDTTKFMEEIHNLDYDVKLPIMLKYSLPIRIICLGSITISPIILATKRIVKGHK